VNAVDPRAVRRAEIFDANFGVGAGEPRVLSREARIIDQHIDRLRAADDDRAAGLERRCRRAVAVIEHHGDATCAARRADVVERDRREPNGSGQRCVGPELGVVLGHGPARILAAPGDLIAALSRRRSLLSHAHRSNRPPAALIAKLYRPLPGK
jgi:hypothetical protein